MRIWSKNLIPVLPTKQLKAMRYELGDMIKQYPNIKNPLVKFANEYDINVLGVYFIEVVTECEKRNINMRKDYNQSIYNLIHNKSKEGFSFYGGFEEDNNEYLKICYWNLYEKHLREIITNEDWQKIKNKYQEVIKNEVD